MSTRENIRLIARSPSAFSWLYFLHQSCMDTSFGDRKELIRFKWPWPDSHGNHSTLIYEPNFNNNSHVNGGRVPTLSLK